MTQTLALPCHISNTFGRLWSLKTLYNRKYVENTSMSIPLLEHWENLASCWILGLCDGSAVMELAWAGWTDRNRISLFLRTTSPPNSIPVTILHGFQAAEVEALHIQDSVPSKARQSPGLPPGFPAAALLNPLGNPPGSPLSPQTLQGPPGWRREGLSPSPPAHHTLPGCCVSHSASLSNKSQGMHDCEDWEVFPIILIKGAVLQWIMIMLCNEIISK